MKGFFNFTNDPLGFKACLFFFVLLVVGIILWNFIGLDSGSGGTPYGDLNDF